VRQASNARKRVAILGASGYTGAELIRLLSRHPQADLVLLTGERHADQPVDAVFPHLGGLDLPRLVPMERADWAGLDVDVVFCALPHGTTQDVVSSLLAPNGTASTDTRPRLKGDAKVIDLSADFRLFDTDTYAQWYGHAHRAPGLQRTAVYGLTEFAREAIAAARLVACPGCYPTTALLPLVPALEAGAIDADNIIIDAKSGVSGAGRAAKEASLFAEVSEGIHAYGVAAHRHAPEIEQELSRAAGAPIIVNFTPHLMPMNRGILATIYVSLRNGWTADDLRRSLAERFTGEPFVRVVPKGVAPATRHVRGSNHCLVGVFEDRLKGRAIVVSVLDNLVKGSAGQAVQNFNLMCELEETRGLEQAPLFP